MRVRSVGVSHDLSEWLKQRSRVGKAEEARTHSFASLPFGRFAFIVYHYCTPFHCQNGYLNGQNALQHGLAVAIGEWPEWVAFCLMQRGSLMVRYPHLSSRKSWDFQFFRLGVCFCANSRRQFALNLVQPRVAKRPNIGSPSCFQR